MYENSSILAYLLKNGSDHRSRRKSKCSRKCIRNRAASDFVAVAADFGASNQRLGRRKTQIGDNPLQTNWYTPNFVDRKLYHLGKGIESLEAEKKEKIDELKLWDNGFTN